MKKPIESYFIRGEGLVGSLEDIENIVVTTRNGMPVYVKDVANVGFGYATRFGAITGNGEGEKVLGSGDDAERRQLKSSNRCRKRTGC